MKKRIAYGDVRKRYGSIEEELEELASKSRGLDPKKIDQIADWMIEEIEDMASDALGTDVSFNGSTFCFRTPKKISVETILGVIIKLKMLEC